MRLLSRPETQDTKNQETALSILRTRELQESEKKARLALIKAEADFKQTLATNQELWIAKEEKHLLRLKELDGEVSKLEERKKTAIVPVDFLKRQAEEKLAEGIEYLADLKKRQEHTEELNDLLQNKLDSLGSKEQDLIKREQVIQQQEKNISLQVEQIKQRGMDLNVEIQTFLKQRTESDADLDNRKTEVKLIEISLESKKELQDQKEQFLLEFSASLDKKEIELERKRKELMKPVEQIISEARADRLQAQEELSDAQKNRIEANALKVAAKKDYEKLLESLSGREIEITKQEARIKNLTSETQKRSNLVADELNKIEASKELIATQKEQLSKSISSFDIYQKNRQAELEKLLKTLEEKENLNKERVEIVKQETGIAQALYEKIKNWAESLKIREESLVSKETQVSVLTQKELKIKEETQKGLEELEQERRAFAEWRTEAEKLVSDREIENKRLSKLNAQKDQKLTRQEKFLTNWDKKLKDERGTLDRVWTELKSKYPPK